MHCFSKNHTNNKKPITFHIIELKKLIVKYDKKCLSFEEEVFKLWSFGATDANVE